MEEIKKGLGKGLNKLLLSLITCLILISFSGAALGQLIVDTNRYVVLDDPNTGTVGAGFFNPSAGRSWNSNLWSGESTTIRAVAVLIDNNGSPLSGTVVTFKLKYPNGTVRTAATTSQVTDSKGMAYYSYNVNALNYWGRWTIEANATIGGNNVLNNTLFTLNWWGCAQCHNNKVSGSLNGTFGSYTPKSYYTMGANFHANPRVGKHSDAYIAGACIICHQSYNGTAKNWGFTSDSPTINTDSEYSPDWHNGKTKCQDCHKGANISNTRAEIAGCYDTAGCHVKKNTNLTRINSTTGYVVGGNYKTNYSDIQNTNVAKAHNDTRVECIVCHGAGHNISKPYNALASSNTNTENEQCWACHTKRTGTHFGETCTSCHSQDAHNVSIGGIEDCIACHNSANPGSSLVVDINFFNNSVHQNINKTPIDMVNNNDCWSCHFSKDMNRQNIRKCNYCHSKPSQWHGNANVTTNLTALAQK